MAGGDGEKQAQRAGDQWGQGSLSKVMLRNVDLILETGVGE